MIQPSKLYRSLEAKGIYGRWLLLSSVASSKHNAERGHRISCSDHDFKFRITLARLAGSFS